MRARCAQPPGRVALAIAVIGAIAPTWVFVVPVIAQTQPAFIVEDFEFATSDAAARAGIIDITDFANTPANYINGDGEGASSNEPGGLYSIGTDLAFCVQFCQPGSFVGFRRYLAASDFPGQCPGSPRHFAPLQYSYGDPEHPGTVPADFPLSSLTLLCDGYGDGAFCDGLSWTNFWLNLVDCEGEVFEFVNLGEVALCSTAWTFDIPMGRSFARLSPESLTDVPNGDRLLTEIAAIEVLIQDENDPPLAIGKWYIDYLRAAEPLAPIPGDRDGDGDVDLVDYAALRACLLGPNQPAPPGCDPCRLDVDGDVDLRDVSLFTHHFGSQQ